MWVPMSLRELCGWKKRKYLASHCPTESNSMRFMSFSGGFFAVLSLLLSASGPFAPKYAPKPLVVHNPLAFRVCDTTFLVEKPYWWDVEEVTYLDSLFDRSSTLEAYRESLEALGDTIAENPRYNVWLQGEPTRNRQVLKMIHRRNVEKGEPLSTHMRDLYRNVSVDLRNALLEGLHLCQPELLNGRDLYDMGEDNYALGDLDRAHHFFTLAQPKATGNWTRESCAARLAYLENLQNPEKVGAKLRSYHTSWLHYVQIGEALRSDSSFAAWDHLLAEQTTAPFSIQDFTDDFEKRYLRTLPVEDLAVYPILIQDLVGDRVLFTPEVIEAVRQAFRDYNLVEHNDFEISIYSAFSYDALERTWAVTFVSDKFGGLVNAVYQGYVFRETEAID